MITIPGKIVNKANSYEVRINPSLWNAIKAQVQAWKVSHPKARPWWIGPSEDSQSFQTAAAWQIKAQSNKHLGKAKVAVHIRLINQRVDADAIKGACDALEESGVINNDRQIVTLLVEHVEGLGKAPSITIDIEPLG